MKAIDAAGLKVRDAGFRADAKLTRISSVTQKMKLDEEGEPDLSDESVRQTVAALWKKQQENFAKVLEALASFKWD